MFFKKKKSKDVPKFLMKRFSLSCISKKISRNVEMLRQLWRCILTHVFLILTAQAGGGGRGG